MKKFDVVVVGSGTAGYTVAKQCAAAGRKVAVVERDVLGGTCALQGCQPKKYFVVQAELSRLAQHLAGKGVATPPTLAWSDVAAFKNEFTTAVPGNTEAYFARIGASLYRGTARFREAGILEVGQDVLKGEAIVLATGARPRQLDVPGGELALDSNAFLAQTALPSSLIFIGGGYISFEFAHVAAAFGAKVTLLNKSDRVLRQFDAELVDQAVVASVEEGVDVLMGQEPEALARTANGIEVRCKNGQRHEAAQVFVAAGRVANLQDLNLEALGLTPSSRGLDVDAEMRVAGVEGLYAVGDCARTPALAPVADREALVASQNILGQTTQMDYRTVPSVCFTQPPVAALGLTEADALAQGLKFTVRRGNTSGWANQRRLGAKHGSYKLLLDDERQLLGAHVFGHEAGDIINLFALAMHGGLPADVFKEMMWAYPTLTSDTKYMV